MSYSSRRPSAQDPGQAAAGDGGTNVDAYPPQPHDNVGLGQGRDDSTDEELLELAGRDLEEVPDTNPHAAVSIPPRGVPVEPARVIDHDGDHLARTQLPMPRHEGYLRAAAEDDLPGESTRVEGHSATVDEPHLVIIGGNDRGKTHALQEGDNSLGRGLDNNIVLADIAVSRKHVLVHREGPRFTVRDLNSGNGALVNGSKMSSARLRDGDQIELGNTLLRFKDPTPLAQPSAEELAQVPTTIGAVEASPFRAPANQEPVDLRKSVSPASPGATRQTNVKKGFNRRKLILFGGGATLILLFAMGGLKLWLNSQQGELPPPANQERPDEVAARHFKSGTDFLRKKEWKKARAEYLEVLKYTPDFDDAKRYLAKTTSELAAQDALQRAKNAALGKDYDGVRRELATIPSTSFYGPEATALKETVERKQVDRLLASVAAFEHAGELAEALKRAKEALKISPLDTRVQKAIGRLKESNPSTAGNPPPARTKRKRSRSSTPQRRKGSGGVRVVTMTGGSREAIRLYGDGKWQQAADAMAEYGRGQSGKRKSGAMGMAQAMRHVAKALEEGQRAQSTDPLRALKEYQRALAEDRKVNGGRHQQSIKARIYKVARLRATTLMASKQYERAKQAVSLATQYGPLDAQLKKVQAELEQRALELFNKGYALKSSSPQQARVFWKRVLKMVDSKSPAYVKAYSYLNENTSVDEDEDEE